MYLNELAKLLKITGDESRLKILCVIFDKNKICVSDIASDTHMSVATVSHHLQVMSKENLITPLRDGKKICYQLVKSSFVKDLKKFVCKYK
jgi:ArsR family transcriptional regulator, lead/cadmium/zinc/bismuth-responsive transcriptional repressor